MIRQLIAGKTQVILIYMERCLTSLVIRKCAFIQTITSSQAKIRKSENILHWQRYRNQKDPGIEWAWKWVPPVCRAIRQRLMKIKWCSMHIPGALKEQERRSTRGWPKGVHQALFTELQGWRHSWYLSPRHCVRKLLDATKETLCSC